MLTESLANFPGTLFAKRNLIFYIEMTTHIKYSLKKIESEFIQESPQNFSRYSIIVSIYTHVRYAFDTCNKNIIHNILTII